ncbi:hypothetical protein [Bradyrhizobium liaoningense]|uniref:hypothetical protein n=1 Tax=Bradyrhizobium liaoningense TaxID=43992 RepID=UPI001BAD1F0C|nr:hypothetical protein [Bradyrhizobium liaoningense]MBR0707014.1 hypothetical protein [Bradyrhizobium liaoningense]
MKLLFRLLDPKVARAFYDWTMGLRVAATIFVGDANLDRFQRWLWGTPREHQTTPSSIDGAALTENVQALFDLFQRQMDAQYGVSVLRRQMLALPAGPDRGC